MDERIINELLPLIVKTKEGIVAGVDILQAEAPDLIHQLYAWEFATSIISLIIGLGVIIAPILIAHPMAMKRKKDNIYDWGLPYLFCVISLIGIPIVLIDGIKWLKIVIAPKLFLIDYISGLLQ